jgi:glucosamine-6-phosphate deaminase
LLLLTTSSQAREVVIIVTGAHKALALQQSIELGVNHMCTLSSLQLHQHALIVADAPATLELKVKTVKYFKDIEAISTSSGFTQFLPTEANVQKKRKSVGDELDRTPPHTPEEKVLHNENLTAEPLSLGVGMQPVRSPTPELRNDSMSSRIKMVNGNGFRNGDNDVADVTLQNMASRVAVA